jgi:hypothetical protein
MSRQNRRFLRDEPKSSADDRFCGTNPRRGQAVFLPNELVDEARRCLWITKRTQFALLEMKLKKRSHCETKPVAKRIGEIVDG